MLLINLVFDSEIMRDSETFERVNGRKPTGDELLIILAGHQYSQMKETNRRLERIEDLLETIKNQ